MVFQDPTGTLNPRHTVYEIVAEGLRIQGSNRSQRRDGGTAGRAGALQRRAAPTREALPAVPARALRRTAPARRDRRVPGARSEIIVADEPVSNLDASVRGEILQLLMKLREQFGLTIIIVTHDLGLAWTVADRVAVMYLGRIVEIGPTEEVLLRPLHPYTKALLDVVPEAEGIDRPILSGEPPDPTRMPGGCRFHPRCPVVASGEAAQLGIEAACRGEDLGLEAYPNGAFAACHKAALKLST